MKNIIPVTLLSILCAACASTDEPVTPPTPHIGSEAAQPPMQGQPYMPPVLQTNPQGAVVVVNDVSVGATPIMDLHVAQFDRIELYAPGYMPLRFVVNSDKAPSGTFMLEPVNANVYNLLVRANVRFVYRGPQLMIEPANLQVFPNAAFVAFDANLGRDVQLTVERIAPHYVILNTNTDIRIAYPITRPMPNNPMPVANRAPSNSPYGQTVYGNAAMNPQAPMFTPAAPRTMTPMY